jgi:hypothetical protein
VRDLFLSLPNACRANLPNVSLLLLAAAAPCTAWPQAELRARNDQQRQIVTAIQDEQSANGPHSPALIAPLTELAALYDRSGDRALAGAAIEHAMQVVRANYGIHALEQAPLLRQRIRIEEERNDLTAAWKLEADLLTLVRRYPDDVRAVPILREVGDRRMALLDEYLGGDYPPEIVLGCYYNPYRVSSFGSCHAGSRGVAARAILADAQRNYAEAITVLLRNELYASDELRELEMILVRSFDLLRTTKDFGEPPFAGAAAGLQNTEPLRSQIDAITTLAGSAIPLRGAGAYASQSPMGERELRDTRDGFVSGDAYALGRLSLRRLVTYDEASDRGPLQQAASLTQLADWDILYARSLNMADAAIETYRRAYRALVDAGVAQTAIDAFFSPPVPVVLPAFLQNPLESQSTNGNTGRIDVAFEITREGRGRNVEVLAATPDVKNGVKDRVVRLIKSSRFRPQLTDGQFADKPVVLRYYVDRESSGS